MSIVRISTLVGGLGIAFLGACAAGDARDRSEDIEDVGESTAALCMPDDSACNTNGAKEWPRWSEQPLRTAAVIRDPDPIKPSTARLSVKACDPAQLGSLPLSPVAHGPDLQNITTNFHALQSLQMMASLTRRGAKAAQSLADEGICVCDVADTPSCKAKLLDPEFQTLRVKRGTSLAECEQFCTHFNGSLAGDGCVTGPANIASNDIYKTGNGAPKWADKTLDWLDGVSKYVRSGELAQSLSAVGAEIDQSAAFLQKLQCYIDLNSEGYMLGAYSAQRPALHYCVPWAGHGAHASFADTKDGRWGIGARYTSHNLSEKLRAQMRTGGFAVTAFGETISFLPGMEFNFQLDPYALFNREAPFGLKGLSVLEGAGITEAQAKKAWLIDGNDPVDVSQFQSMAGDDGRLSVLELLGAMYAPFGYPQPASTSVWPRRHPTTKALVLPNEAQTTGVLGAALNLELEVKPIEKTLAPIAVAPGVFIIPYFELEAGAKWFDEAYQLRERLLTAINKNLTTPIDRAVFERNMHGFQAPDVSTEMGSQVRVAPEIGAKLLVGFKLGKRAEIGVAANLGLQVDIKPTGSGGVVDMSRPLVAAALQSNPDDSNLECKPSWTYENQMRCSNRLDPKSSGNFLCSLREAPSACVLTFKKGSGTRQVCLETSTGIDSSKCATSQVNRDNISDYALPHIETGLDGYDRQPIAASWLPNTTCSQCVASTTCAPNTLRNPNVPDASSCARHGYCCQPTVRTAAGKLNQAGLVDGIGASASVSSPMNFVLDATTNKVFFTDVDGVRSLNPDTGEVKFLLNPSLIGVSGLGQLAFDGNRTLYTSTMQGLWKVDTRTGAASKTPYAGARFDGLVYASGALYAADEGGRVIRRIDPATGASSVVVGVEGQSGTVDGVGSAGRLAGPNHPVWDGARTLYFMDEYHLRSLDLATARVATLAGNGTGATIDGFGTAASFQVASGMTLNLDGTLLISQYSGGGSTGGGRIRVFSPGTGQVSTLTPPVNAPPSDAAGLLSTASTDVVLGLAALGDGRIAFGTGLSRIRIIDPGCDETVTGAVTHDVTDASCSAKFTPYECIRETQTGMSGWSGPGCHPLLSGFPSVAQCSSSRDCTNSERCDAVTRKCVVTTTNVVTASTCGGGVSCGIGRNCVAGACVKRCTYSAATALTTCGDSRECTPSGLCAPRGNVPWAESLVQLASTPPALPMHSIATYALAEMELLASLQAGVDVGLKFKLFGKWRNLKLFQWARGFDIGSLAKTNLQPGLEVSYQSDMLRMLGTVTNHQPDQVTRLKSDSLSANNPNALLEWCDINLPGKSEDPEVATNSDIGGAITDTVTFGERVGTKIWDQEAMCIDGTPMLTWLHDENAVVSTFGSGSCRYTGTVPAGKPAPGVFECADSDRALLKIWGCLDTTTSIGAQALAQGAWSSAVQNGQFNLARLLLNVEEDLIWSNLKPEYAQAHAAYVPTWLKSVEACFETNYAKENICKCSTNADCDLAAGLSCVSNVCRDAKNEAALCAPVEAATAKTPVRCCGDGVPGGKEECDDGNAVSGDGCSADCKREQSAACCLATGCETIPGGAQPRANCQLGGGNWLAATSCSAVKDCGMEVEGSCLIGGQCRSPLKKSECAALTGAFSPLTSCVLTPDPRSSARAWFPLEDTTSTIVERIAGRNGVASLPYTSVQGVTNRGIRFSDQTASGFQADSGAARFGFGDFSIGLWSRQRQGSLVSQVARVPMLPAGSSTSFAAIANGPQPIPPPQVLRGFRFFIEGQSLGIHLHANNDSIIRPLLTSPLAELADSRWHHVAVTVARQSSTGVRFYLDGVLRGTHDSRTAPGDLTVDVPLSVIDNSFGEHGGEMDEVLTFARALTEPEVRFLATPR